MRKRLIGWATANHSTLHPHRGVGTNERDPSAGRHVSKRMNSSSIALMGVPYGMRSVPCPSVCCRPPTRPPSLLRFPPSHSSFACSVAVAAISPRLRYSIPAPLSLAHSRTRTETETMQIEPTADVGTAWDDAAQLPTPPAGPLPGAIPSLSAILSSYGSPKSSPPPSPGGTGRSDSLASWLDPGLDIEDLFDTIMRLADDALQRVAAAKLVRRVAKLYALLSQGLHGGTGGRSNG